MKFIVTALAFTLSSGCAFKVEEVKDFDPSKPVQNEKASLGSFYRQDGIIVNQFDMANKLQQESATAKTMEHFGALAWSGIFLGAFGGGLIGYGLGTAIGGGKPQLAGPAAGVAAIAGGMYLANTADSKLEDAVKLHNEFLLKKAAYTPLFHFRIAAW